jgi:broad specificity phosphatase PhoE
MELLSDIHDPGLSPGGITDAKSFPALYRHLRSPSIVVTSPLRRCLQTAVYAFGEQAKTGTIRIIAHPDLQEVSNCPCDTGTPLDLLRKEFPLVEFPDERFTVIWPRSAEVRVQKRGTIYADEPNLLYKRALRIKQWIKCELDAEEIVVVTHGSFAHFLFNDWSGTPGDSRSFGDQLGNAKARTFTMPGPMLPGAEFGAFAAGTGPDYLVKSSREDYSLHVCEFGTRDCGVFTDDWLL